MKKKSHQGIILCILALSLFSCESIDDSIKVNARAASSKEKASALTCDKLLSSFEDYEGQVIDLNAICWGVNTSVDGEEILMSLADEKLVGLQQAHVLVHFTKEQKEEIEKIKENDSISVTAKVDTFSYGALRLIEAKVKTN